MKKPRMYASLAVLGLLLAAAFLVPLPYSIICPLELQARDAHPVYVDVLDGGKLSELLVKAGDRVEKGQALARLENVDLELEIAKLTGSRAQYERRLDTLRQQGIRNPRAASEVSQVEESLANIREQLAQKQADQERLVLKAPAAGTVLPPPEKPVKEEVEGQLPAWSGSPLDRENQGAFLEEGTMFCQIGDPKKYSAILVIDQTDVEFVREILAHETRPRVDIKLDELPNSTLHSEVTEVAESELKVSPKRLTSKTGGELATQTDPETGQEKLRDTSFQARAPVDDPDGVMRLGLRGAGRVYTAWQPLGVRLWRLLSHTFRFKM